MIDKETVERIFAEADIVDVVSDFVQLKRKGTNYTACCPFHNEKTPSFIVSPAKGLYKCFGCGEGGSAVKFVMTHEKLSFVDALKWLAKKYNIPIREKTLTPQEIQANDDRESMMVLNSWAEKYFREQLNTPSGQNIAKAYLYERGMSDQTIERFALGYSPEKGSPMTSAALREGFQEKFLVETGLSGKNESDKRLYDRYSGRVIFPIHSLSGRVIGFGGRTMRSDKKVAKYVNSPESQIYHKSHTLYGIHLAKRSISQNDKCILVEGYTDVISLHQSGIENVVASSGTSLTVGQIKLIKRFTQNVTLIYDGDSAGIKASMRGVDMLLGEGLSVRVVPLPPEDDPDSFARAHNTAQIEEYIHEHEEDFITFKIRTLMASPQSDDPIKRAQIISDIIGSLVVIPDNVQRSVYIAQCSRLMDIERDVLEREVRVKRAGRVDGAAGAQVARAQIAKERFESRQNTTPADAPPDDLFAPMSNAPQPMSVGERELINLEREICASLIRYGDKSFDYATTPEEVIELGVAQTIIDELREEQIEISHEPYRTIFEDYCRYYDREEHPPMGWFLNHQNPMVSQFLVDIETQDELYKPSRIWERHEIVVRTESENLAEWIPKSLVIYKAKVLAERVETLQRSLVGVESMEEAQEVISQISRLNGIRSTLLDRYQRLR
ncbi:MAG: DNA primase [Rikenellaceae bacterium]